MISLCVAETGEEFSDKFYSSPFSRSRIFRIVSPTAEAIALIASFTSASLGAVGSGVGDTVPVAVGTAVCADVGCDVSARVWHGVC